MPDVFPRRNLNPDAEQWGREVEVRATSLETDVGIVGQQVQSLNRNTASSLSLLSQQIEGLRQTQALIPINSAQSTFVSGFAPPSTSYAQIVRIDVPNPGDRRQLSILCIGSVRLYESSVTPDGYSQSIIRIYNAGTDALITFGASIPCLRDGRPGGTLHASTPFQASSFTTPDEGIYVTLELLVTDTAKFPFDASNLMQLAVQTSFL